MFFILIIIWCMLTVQWLNLPFARWQDLPGQAFWHCKLQRVCWQPYVHSMPDKLLSCWEWMLSHSHKGGQLFAVQPGQRVRSMPGQLFPSKFTLHCHSSSSMQNVQKCYRVCFMPKRVCAGRERRNHQLPKVRHGKLFVGIISFPISLLTVQAYVLHRRVRVLQRRGDLHR